MRTLVIECATEACSLALFGGEELLAHSHEVLGRGHAERLIPRIAELPEKGKAGRIAVSLGPGSFTGVRIGLAAARALGLAWGVPVLGYPSLALVAATARSHVGEAKPISVGMTGGHGEFFMQNFDAQGMPQDDVISLKPQDAARAALHDAVAGSQASALVELRGSGKAFPLHPDARAFLHLPAALLSGSISPVYGRAPDAKIPTIKP